MPAPDPLFSRCFELAPEAFHHHSFPVGALIVDADGAVVAEGRNRMGERSAPDGFAAGYYRANAGSIIEAAEHVVAAELWPAPAHGGEPWNS